MAQTAKALPSLKRRLLLILGAFSLLLLLALAALLVKQDDVRALVLEGNETTVPAIVERQQAAANLERMLRFGWIAATAASPDDWRPAGRAAQALSYHPSLSVQAGLRENVKLLYGMVRRVLTLREEALALRKAANDETDLAVRHRMENTVNRMDQKARALWAPQDSLLLDVQSELAADMSRMTREHFDSIDHIASVTQIAAMIAAAVMLLSIFGAALVIRRDLFRPVLRLSEALRDISDQRGLEALASLKPASSEIATIHGAAYRLRQALINVTEQARALREGESRLQSLFDASDAGIAITDADGVIIAANASLCRLSGQSADDLIGSSLSMGTHPEDRIGELQLVGELKSGKRANYRLEKRYLHSDQSIIWVESTVTALHDVEGGVNGFVTVVIDTTEAHRIHEQLLFTQSIIDKSSEPVYCVDPSDGYRFVYVNAATCRHYGVDRETLLRMRVSDFDENYKSVTDSLDYFGSAVITDAVVKETIHKVAEGKTLPVEISANYFIYRGRDYVAGYIRDITDRTQWTAEVQRSNRELQQFAYVASHDLQEPLRMVASFLQLLKQRHSTNLTPEAKEYITYAVDGAVRMKQIIEDLLQYSRLDTSQRTLDPVDLKRAYDTALLNLRESIASTSATIRCSEGLGWVLADTGQMSRLFQNLIGNALKYRDLERPPEIHIWVVKDDGEWCTVAVQDNGIGIEKDYYEKIFLIFQRLHSNRAYVGTGIGLAICKRIIEHCGGQIWVESQIGEGSTFYFTVKRVETPAALCI